MQADNATEEHQKSNATEEHPPQKNTEEHRREKYFSNQQILAVFVCVFV